MRKLLLCLALLLGAQFTGLTPALAVCGTGVGNCFFATSPGGNSNDTTKWFNATNATGACSCVPLAGDTVTLDATAGNLTVNAAFTTGSFDATGYTGTLAGSSAWNTNGTTFKLVAGMTFSYTGTVTFSGSGTDVITSAGKTFQNMTLNGTGTYQFADTLAVNPNGTLTLTAGTLDAGTNNVALNIGSYNGSGGGTRTVLGGTNTWTILGRSAGFDSSYTTSTLSNPTTAFANTTICLCVTNPIGSRTLTLGNNITFGTVTLSGGTTPTNNGGFSITWTGSIAAATIGTLNLTAPLYIIGAGSISTTITNTPNTSTWSATASNPIFMNNVKFSNAGSPVLTNFTVVNATLIGSAWTFNSSYDIGGNTLTGGAINPPSAGGGGHIIGG
jgi:hypothetical protein